MFRNERSLSFFFSGHAHFSFAYLSSNLAPPLASLRWLRSRRRRGSGQRQLVVAETEERRHLQQQRHRQFRPPPQSLLLLCYLAPLAPRLEATTTLPTPSRPRTGSGVLIRDVAARSQSSGECAEPDERDVSPRFSSNSRRRPSSLLNLDFFIFLPSTPGA